MDELTDRPGEGVPPPTDIPLLTIEDHPVELGQTGQLAARAITVSSTFPGRTRACTSAGTPSTVPHVRALITWLAVHPSITVASMALTPVTTGLPLALRALVLTALVVPIVVYVLVPTRMRLRSRRRGTLTAWRQRRANRGLPRILARLGADSTRTRPRPLVSRMARRPSNANAPRRAHRSARASRHVRRSRGTA